MTEQAKRDQTHRVVGKLMEFLLPMVGFGLGVFYAIRRVLPAIVSGVLVSGAIFGLYRLDLALIRPRLQELTRDWLQLGLEMTFSFLEHLLGALGGLLICGLLFGFTVEPTTTWIVLAGLVVAFPIIHGTDTALRYFRQLKEKERLEEQLRILATEAELKALKAQINPHFLFNTLNTIAQLIHSDSAQAEATVERLADMLRYTLVGSESKEVPLREELAFVDTYLEIEKARFGGQLRIVREVAPQPLDVPVPSLILQPLVENAVRHGRGPDGSIDLRIRVQARDDAIVIAVSDRGPGIPPGYEVAAGHGVGLRSVDERLRKSYGEAYGVQIRENEPQGTVVVVRIPL